MFGRIELPINESDFLQGKPFKIDNKEYYLLYSDPVTCYLMLNLYKPNASHPEWYEIIGEYDFLNQMLYASVLGLGAPIKIEFKPE